MPIVVHDRCGHTIVVHDHCGPWPLWSMTIVVAPLWSLTGLSLDHCGSWMQLLAMDHNGWSLTIVVHNDQFTIYYHCLYLLGQLLHDYRSFWPLTIVVHIDQITIYYHHLSITVTEWYSTILT